MSEKSSMSEYPISDEMIHQAIDTVSQMAENGVIPTIKDRHGLLDEVLLVLCHRLSLPTTLEAERDAPNLLDPRVQDLKRQLEIYFEQHPEL